MKKVLVIEDEKAIRELYEAILSNIYDVTYAVNGQDAFRLAMSESYDVIIADLAMANWNGAEAVAAVDLIGNGNKFIIVSGYLNDDRFQNLLNDIPNIVAKIPKPFSNESLLAAIESAIGTDSEEESTES